MRRRLSQLRGRNDIGVLRVTAFRCLLYGLVLSALAPAMQTRMACAQASVNSTIGVSNPCNDPSTHVAIKDAFRLLCSRESIPLVNVAAQKAIVIGFLGGFVKRNDVKHPEVVFVNYVRSRYGPAVHTAVFGNHESKKALELIHQCLDADENGSEDSIENKTVKIILYGHSWGASQVLEFARELERQGVPVSLTIQIDSVRKIEQNDRSVPANVAKAVNFYQTKGLTPGQPRIIPANAGRTTVVGNFHMTYKHNDIRCDNYRWLSRILNKSHHQIENDPNVWDKIVTLIDSELLTRDSRRSDTN